MAQGLPAQRWRSAHTHYWNTFAAALHCEGLVIPSVLANLWYLSGDVGSRSAVQFLSALQVRSRQPSRVGKAAFGSIKNAVIGMHYAAAHTDAHERH